MSHPGRVRSNNPEESTGKLTRGSPVAATMLGGNLSTLASCVGTKSQLKGNGSIVFLQETW